MKNLKRVILVCLSLFGIIFVINTLFFTIGFKTESFGRWSQDQYAGKIVELHPNYFVIETKKQAETKTISINKDTVIMLGRGKVMHDELLIGRYVVVFGSQNQEQTIEARMIRIFDGKNFKVPPSR